jgi:uncharacterized protein (TIGR03545 family)
LRKKGVIVLLIVAALFVLWTYFLSDRWLEKRLESLLGRIAGAKVELDGFDFSLFKMRMEWDRLRFTDADDPWKNLFETGYCVLDMEPGPIFKRKFIIEEMQLQALRFDTARETDGTLEVKTKRKKGPSKLGTMVRDRLERKLSKLPLFDTETLVRNIDVEAIWRRVEPSAPGKITGLVQVYERFAEGLDARFMSLNAEEELASVAENLDAIDVEKLDTPEEMKDAASRLDRIAERMKSVTRTIEESGGELGKEIEKLESASASVQSWIEEDLARIRDEVKIPRITLENVAEFLFGRKLTERVLKVLKIVEKFRAVSAKIRRFVPVLEVPPRLRGQDISFEKDRGLPAVWFKHASFSSFTRDDILIEGSLQDLSSGQHLTGKPAVLEAAGGMEGKRSIVLTGLFDWRESVPKDSLRLSMRDIVLQDIFITDFPLVPNTLEKGTASLDAGVEFTGEALTAGIVFLIEDVSFTLLVREPRDPIEQLLYEVSSSIAADIDSIRIEAGLEILPERTSLTLRSNLDTIVTGRVDEVLQREARRVTQQLAEKLWSEVKLPQEELDRIARETEAQVIKRLREIGRLRDEIEAEIGKKRGQIEEKIEEETVGKAKKELEEQKRKKEEGLEQERLKKERELEEERKKAEEAIKGRIESLF